MKEENNKFYTNILKNNILITPDKKLRELEDIPGYFRIMNKELKPTFGRKNKELIKEEKMMKCKQVFKISI